MSKHLPQKNTHKVSKWLPFLCDSISEADRKKTISKHLPLTHTQNHIMITCFSLPVTLSSWCNERSYTSEENTRHHTKEIYFSKQWNNCHLSCFYVKSLQELKLSKTNFSDDFYFVCLFSHLLLFNIYRYHWILTALQRVSDLSSKINQCQLWRGRGRGW